MSRYALALDVGGSFGMTFLTNPSESPDAPNISVAAETSESVPEGQERVYPEFAVTAQTVRSSPHASRVRPPRSGCTTSSGSASSSARASAA